MANHSLDGLPPFERALRGSMDDVQRYLDDKRQQSWPQIRLLVTIWRAQLCRVIFRHP